MEKLIGFSFLILGSIFIVTAAIFPSSNIPLNINTIMHGITLVALGSIYLKIIELSAGKVKPCIKLNPSNEIE